MPHSTRIHIEPLTEADLAELAATVPQPADWEGVIVSDPGTASGRPRVKGTRLTVEFILNLFAAGWTEEEVLENYPTLTRNAIRAAFAFAAARLSDLGDRRRNRNAG